MSTHIGFSYCLCCRRRVHAMRLLCHDCDKPLDREPTTEWGKARKAEREARSEGES